jgi:hypothetical protein
MSPSEPPLGAEVEIVIVLLAPDAVVNTPASLPEVIAAEAFTSALTIVPSTRFAEATVIAVGNAPVASLDNAIAAEALTSASTIVPSTRFAEATVTVVGNAPVPNLVKVIAAEALISASTIVPSAIFA